MDDAIYTMCTVEDEESATERIKVKKKSKADTALEKFALATVAKSLFYSC